MSNSIGVIIYIIVILIIFKIVTTNFNGGPVTYVKASNGVEYLVRNLPDKSTAAELLVELTRRGKTLVAHLQKNFPNDPRTKNVSIFDFKNISESSDTTDYTTYTESKHHIYFCLRNKDSIAPANISEPGCNSEYCGPFVDINLLSGVCFHELTHIGMSQYDPGHSGHFQYDLKFILGEAIKLGLYTNTDYSKTPAKYCGTVISNALI